MAMGNGANLKKLVRVHWSWTPVTHLGGDYSPLSIQRYVVDD